MGLLDVSANMLTGYQTFIVTIDNATAPNVYDSVMEGAFAYIRHYYQYNWPDKAVIYVNKAGGTQIGTGTVYSKWVTDWLSSRHNLSSGQTLTSKVRNATRVWTWELT